MPYDVNAIRQKLKQSQGKFSDPDEFKPEKATSSTEATKYVFYILPPLCEGDKLKSGVVKRDMDSQFYITHGSHWVESKPYPCPRLITHETCPICEFGFRLLKDEKVRADQAKKDAVVRQWMPTQYSMMNIFFPNSASNPESLRGKVMYYNAPRTVVDICSACLMRDDEGDPESPEAFGVFYDENNALAFELQVLKQGKQNSYKTSKFRPKGQPIVKNQDGTPNQKAMAQLLALRHNLFDKIEEPNRQNLERVFDKMVNGDDSADDDKGFDSDDEAKPVVEVVHSKNSAVGKKAIPVVVEDDFEAEAPLPEVARSIKTVVTKPTVKTPIAKAPVKAPVEPEDDGVDKNEIDDLLGQLEDD